MTSHVSTKTGSRGGLMSAAGARALQGILVICLWSMALAGCAVYEVRSTPSPAVFDRAWNAALGGMQDAGVQVTAADPATGMIRGTRNGIDATAIVARQADGSVRVQFETKGPTQRDPDLPNRFSQAYDRRMGR